MKANNKNKPKIIIFLFVIVLIFSCGNYNQKKHATDITFRSFREIPDISAEEIAAIESLQKQRASFVYGVTPTTEAFLNEDGEIAGYSALLCEWLTELFEIPFVPEYVTWTGLLDGLKTGQVDFAGDLSPTEERKEIYYMTSGTAHRWLCSFRLEGTEPLSEIARRRPVRYALIRQSTTINNVFKYAAEKFYPVYADEYEQAYELLKNGLADALVTENTSEAFFETYSDVVMENFLPLLDSPVCLSTQNPDLEPVISIVQKALNYGGSKHLAKLYDKGYNEYKKHKLLTILSKEEKEYIRNNPVIPFAAEYDNYPSTFYNTRNHEWQGVIIDVLKEIEILTGFNFDLANDEKTNWSEILEMLETGKVLFVAELIKTEDREGRFLWPDTSIFTDRSVLISKSDHDNISIYKVPGVMVGLPKATAHAELFQRWFPNDSNIIIYESQDAAYNALLNDDVDMIMSSYSNMLYIINYLERVDVKPNIIFDNYYGSTFGFYKDASVLCSIFDKALELIDINIISNQWTNRTYDYRVKIAEARIPYLVIVIIISLAALALTIILFFRNRKVSVEKAVIRESEQRVKLILNASPLSVILIDKNFQCVYVNQESVRLYGLSSKQEYFDLYSKGKLVLERGGEFLREAFTNGYWNGELNAIKPDGEKIPCNITLIRVKYKDDFVVAGYARDLREEKKMLAEIESHHLLQTILEIVPVGIYIMSRKNGEMLYGNKAALNLFNSKSFEEDVAGHNSLYFLPEVQPNGKKSIDMIPQLREHNEGTFELQCKKLTGELFHARVSYCLINYNGIDASLNAIEDLTAEKEYQQMLRNTAIKEQEANQLKSSFLAKMSHEIRTPMNAITGMAELALREDTAKKKNEYIQTVKQASSNLLAIINDILDLSKIEAGKMEIIPEEYSVESLLNDLISIIRMRVVDSTIRFAVKVDSKIPCTLLGDETRIRQAVLNILNNAVKYTEKGFVSFSVYSAFTDNENVNLIFEVADSGIGIKEEDVNKLFTDFTQLDPEKTRGIEGVGLGLSITKNIVDAMNGKIEVRSKYGEGSTFTITLPQKCYTKEILAKVDDPQNKKTLILIYERRDINAESIAYTLNNLGVECTIITKGTELYEEMENKTYNYLFIPYVLYKRNEDTILKFGSDTKIVIISTFGEAIPEKNIDILTLPVYCTQIADIFNGVTGTISYNTNNETMAKFTAVDARVLIVDDINTNLKVAEGLLAPYNMQIDLLSSGAAAIEAVKNNRYDLVFMDHKMPGMDGIEATQQIREQEKTQGMGRIPIIALTANAVAGMMEMFIENGFNDFLSKPIDTVKLNAILEKWLPKEKQIRGDF